MSNYPARRPTIPRKSVSEVIAECASLQDRVAFLEKVAAQATNSYEFHEERIGFWTGGGTFITVSSNGRDPELAQYLKEKQ